MVWFQCESCGENLKKPKLQNHFRGCAARKLSCIDCGVVFDQQSVQVHTSCVSETEKYGPKDGSKGSSQKPKSSLGTGDGDLSIGLSTSAPWNCSLCKVNATSYETLEGHSLGKKHRAKAKAAQAKINSLLVLERDLIASELHGNGSESRASAKANGSGPVEDGKSLPTLTGEGWVLKKRKAGDEGENQLSENKKRISGREIQRMKGCCCGHCRLRLSTVLLFLLLCPLQGAFSIGHRHGSRSQVGLQLIQAHPPSASQLPSSPAPSLLIPTASPIVFSPNYGPSEAPSGFMPFVAPSPLEIPVITNPTTPELSGLCPFNFTALEDTLVRTAGDCPAPLALYVGSVICCPQLESLFQVSLGLYSVDSGNLGLNSTEAAYCFSDTENLMASLGANTSVGDLCAAQPANLTSGLCPVTKVSQLQDIVNTTMLLDACQSVDPLKECTEEPTCQSQITYVASQMAGELVDSSGHFNGSLVPPGEQQVVIDCKNMVLAWLASKLGPTAANNMLRNLISCRVNKECPLEFGDPVPVAKSCGCSINPSNISCCRALESYLLDVQQQMLITNLQALRCVTLLASVLQNMSVSADIYSLCGIDLKDFSLQGVGGQGCLLSSLPSDIVSNVTGIDFTCDLNDNIAAPWIRTLDSNAAHSICGQPPVALPAFPETSGASLFIGHTRENILIMATCVVFIIAMRWK